MGFCLSVTGPCRDCMDAEILVRRSRNWIGDSISVPIYKVWCKHENVCRKLQQQGAALRPLSRDEEDE